MNNQDRLLKDIQKVMNNEWDRYSAVKVSENTPKILQDIGMKDYPILVTPKHIRSCLHKKGKNPHWHGLTTKLLTSLPTLINEPAIIMDSLTDQDSIVVVCDKVDNDELPIMVSIKANGIGQYELKQINANFISSIYGKQDFERYLERCIDIEFVIYANKEKTKELSSFAKLQLLGKFPQDFRFNKIIKQSQINDNEIVKKVDGIKIKNKAFSEMTYSELVEALHIQDLELKDDNTNEYGGLAFAGETLGDFMDAEFANKGIASGLFDNIQAHDLQIKDINDALNKCGIQRITLKSINNFIYKQWELDRTLYKSETTKRYIDALDLQLPQALRYALSTKYHRQSFNRRLVEADSGKEVDSEELTKIYKKEIEGYKCYAIETSEKTGNQIYIGYKPHPKMYEYHTSIFNTFEDMAMWMQEGAIPEKSFANEVQEATAKQEAERTAVGSDRTSKEKVR